MLEKKKKLFSVFYDILRSKNAKILERQRAPQNEGLGRYRSRNMNPEDVIHALAQMGVTREEAEVALENIEYPDQNLAIDWIDNNQEQLGEIIVNRTMERTRAEAYRRQTNSNLHQVGADQIVPLSYEHFHGKEKLIKQSRSWIKIVFKELFRE